MNLLLRLIGLPRWVQALGGAGLLLAAAGIWLHFHDRSVIRDHERKIEAAAAPAREQAAQERVHDAAANAKREGDMHHAIDTAAPGGALSPAARALACERLRQHGRAPPACRPDRGDRGQADPR
jgi:hypothetical protein